MFVPMGDLAGARFAIWTTPGAAVRGKQWSGRKGGKMVAWAWPGDVEISKVEEQITGAQITGAQITGAQITGAQITGAQITGAKRRNFKQKTESRGERRAAGTKARAHCWLTCWLLLLPRFGFRVSDLGFRV